MTELGRPSRMSEKYPPRTNESEQATAEQAVADLISEALIGHVAFVADDGQPLVLPTAIAGDHRTIWLHGSTGSSWLRHPAGGATATVAVTSLDALVVARSAFESSMHYRSAVLIGRCRRLSGAEAEHALDRLTDALIPGRVAELRRPTAKERAATQVLELTVEDWTFKESANWPEDPAEDVAGPSWAGVLPRVTRYRSANPAPDLRPDRPIPASVQALLDPPAHSE